MLSSLIIRIQDQSCLAFKETSVKTVNFTSFMNLLADDSLFLNVREEIFFL